MDVYGMYLLVFLVYAVICGAIACAVASSRGMDGGFGWGFFLGIIGILVVALRPNDKAASSTMMQEYSPSAVYPHEEKAVFELSRDLYAQGAPVIISSGILLKDEQTEGISVKCTIQNIDARTIIAAKLVIHPMDAAGRLLGQDVECDYLDLHVRRGNEFGSEKSFSMPNATAREFSAEVTQVIFEDKSVWIYEGEAWDMLPGQKPVGDVELVKQFKARYGEKAEFKPIQHKDLWICACGGVNRIDKDTSCYACANKLTDLLQCDYQELENEKKKRLAAEAKEREAIEAERQATIKAKAKKKRTWSVIIAIVIVIAAGAGIWDLIAKKTAWNKQCTELKQRYADTLSVKDIGDIITFGAYEQDNRTSNGKEPVEWIVLKKESSRAMLLSKRILDWHVYCEQWYRQTDWKTSDIKKWLNETFLTEAFEELERTLIVPETKSDIDNTDRIYLLKIEDVTPELLTQLGSDEYGITKYAITVGEKGYMMNSTEWWLRSQGKDKDDAATVHTTTVYNKTTGSYSKEVVVNKNGSINYWPCGVRPAIWISWE